MTETSRRRVLIVEDEPIIALDLAGRLERLGYEIVGRVESADDALESARRDSPDLVLMDIRLGEGGDGVAAANKLRETVGSPVLFVTAHGDPRTVAETRDAGAFGILLKPFDDNRLRTSVEIALHAGDANRKLRESERRYSLTLKSIGDAVIAADAGGRVTFLNPAAERMTGWTREESLGKPLVEVFRLRDEQTGHLFSDEFLLRILHDGQATLPEGTTLLSRDGRRVPVEDSASIMIDERGATVGFVITFMDMTERRKLSAERDELLARMRMLFDRMPVGCVVNDENFAIVDWNPACERIFGFTRAEVAGKSPYDTIVPPEGHAVVREIEARMRAGDASAHGLGRNVTKDGRTVKCEWTNTPLVADDGRVTGFLSMVQDVTDRIERERKLVESERMFKAAFEEAPHGMIMVEVGERATIRRANKAFAGMLEMSVGGVDGASAKELTHPDDFAAQFEAMSAFFRGDTNLFRVVKRYRKSDGTWLWTQLSATLVRDADGQPLFGIGHVIDLTEARAARGTSHADVGVPRALRTDANPRQTRRRDRPRLQQHPRRHSRVRVRRRVGNPRLRSGFGFAATHPRSGRNGGGLVPPVVAIRRSRPRRANARRPAGIVGIDAGPVDDVGAEAGNADLEPARGAGGGVRRCFGSAPGDPQSRLQRLAVVGRTGGTGRRESVRSRDRPAVLRGSVLPERDVGGRFAVLEVSDTGGGIEPALLPHIFDPFVSSRGRRRDWVWRPCWGSSAITAGTFCSTRRWGSERGFGCCFPLAAIAPWRRRTRYAPALPPPPRRFPRDACWWWTTIRCSCRRWPRG